jgi:hypothetical protein
MRYAGHVVYMGEIKNTYSIFVGKPDKEPIWNTQEWMEE